MPDMTAPWAVSVGRLWMLPETAEFITHPEPMDTPIFDALYAARFWPLRWVLGVNVADLDLEHLKHMPHYVWTPGTGGIEFKGGPDA